ncbi:MAG: hypothetical protein QXM50_06860 [Candidatus Caldarchaeum sp.]
MSIIRPRKNARTDREPPSSRSAARMIRNYGYYVWRREVGYGRRWMTETTTFGEEILPTKPRWINVEIIQKAYIFNLLLNTA